MKICQFVPVWVTVLQSCLADGPTTQVSSEYNGHNIDSDFLQEKYMAIAKKAAKFDNQVRNSATGFPHDKLATRTTEPKHLDMPRLDAWPSQRRYVTKVAIRKTRVTRQRTRTTVYKTREPKETCHHGLEITNDRWDVAELRSAFERIRDNGTRVRRTYKPKSTQTPVWGNATRTKKTRNKLRTMEVTRKNEEVRDHVVKKREVGDKGDLREDHVVKKREIDDTQRKVKVEKDGKHNVGKRHADKIQVAKENERVFGRLQRVMRDIKTLRKKREVNNAPFQNDIRESNIRGRLDRVIAQTDLLRKKRAVAPLQNELIETNSFGDNSEARLLEDRIREDKLLDRDKRFVGGSKMEYLSRAAKEKMYRSYEDYNKRVKGECPEDKVCRMFKEEMQRQDSFDGLGFWNEGV